jgi:hypothetical protein
MTPCPIWEYHPPVWVVCPNPQVSGTVPPVPENSYHPLTCGFGGWYGTPPYQPAKPQVRGVYHPYPLRGRAFWYGALPNVGEAPSGG